MYKTAGIKFFSYEERFLGELKSALLLFDLVGVPYLERFLWPIERTHSSDCFHKAEIKEMRILQKHGFLFNAWNGIDAYLKNDLNVDEFTEEFDHLLDVAVTSKNYEKVKAAETYSPRFKIIGWFSTRFLWNVSGKLQCGWRTW